MSTLTEIKTAKYSGDYRVDSLLDWNSNYFYSGVLNYLPSANNTIYYCFDTSNETIKQLNRENYSPLMYIEDFNPTQKNAAEVALNYISDITGIQFLLTKDPGQATIIFANADIERSSTVTAMTLSHIYTETDSNDNITSLNIKYIVALDNVEYSDENLSPVIGSYGYQILLHELGHVLGLKHPFSQLGENSYTLSEIEDNTTNTLMSYTEKHGDNTNKTEYAMYDLLALQWLYGGDGLAGNFGINSTYGSSLTIQKIVSNLTENAKMFLPQLTEIYLTLFNRPADVNGANYWADILAVGNIESIKMGFLYSQEFINLFGEPTTIATESQIQQVYANILGRDAEQNGLEYWLLEAQKKQQDIFEVAETMISAVKAQQVENTPDYEHFIELVATAEAETINNSTQIF